MIRNIDINREVNPTIFQVRSSLASCFSLILSSFSGTKGVTESFALAVGLLLFDLLLVVIKAKIRKVGKLSEGSKNSFEDYFGEILKTMFPGSGSGNRANNF